MAARSPWPRTFASLEQTGRARSTEIVRRRQWGRRCMSPGSDDSWGLAGRSLVVRSSQAQALLRDVKRAHHLVERSDGLAEVRRVGLVGGGDEGLRAEAE